jgi:hypothetical protein
MSQTAPGIVQVGGTQDVQGDTQPSGLKGVTRKLTAPVDRVFSALVRKKSTTEPDGPTDPFLDTTTTTNTKPEKSAVPTQRRKKSPVASRAKATASQPRRSSRPVNGVQSADSSFVPGFDSQMEKLRAQMQTQPQRAVRPVATRVTKDEKPLDLDTRPTTPRVKTNGLVDRRSAPAFEQRLNAARTETVASQPTTATVIVDPFLKPSDSPTVNGPNVADNRREKVEFGPRLDTTRETVRIPREAIVPESVTSPVVQSGDKRVRPVTATIQQVSASARPLPVGIDSAKSPAPQVNLTIPDSQGVADPAMIVDSNTVPKRLDDVTGSQRSRFADLNSSLPKGETDQGEETAPDVPLPRGSSRTQRRDAAIVSPVEFQFSGPTGALSKGGIANFNWEEEPAGAESVESAASFSTSTKITWGLALAFMVVLVLRSRSYRRFNLAR